MQNIPEVKLGIVAVSRDCFPITLSEKRRKAVVAAFKAKGYDIYESPVIIEGGIDANVMDAYEDIQKAGINALVVFLGNFGPEGPETLIAQKFGGPVMYVAAAEENIAVLSSERGDAYCGMLNASYNLKLSGINAYIPEYPVGTAEECADMIAEFIPIARTLLALKDLKIITFGRVRSTSSPATRPSRRCSSWASTFRRTPSWICWPPTRPTPTTPASPPRSRRWRTSWARATRCPASCRAWRSTN